MFLAKVSGSRKDKIETVNIVKPRRRDVAWKMLRVRKALV